MIIETIGIKSSLFFILHVYTVFSTLLYPDIKQMPQTLSLKDFNGQLSGKLFTQFCNDYDTYKELIIQERKKGVIVGEIKTVLDDTVFFSTIANQWASPGNISVIKSDGKSYLGVQFIHDKHRDVCKVLQCKKEFVGKIITKSGDVLFLTKAPDGIMEDDLIKKVLAIKEKFKKVYACYYSSFEFPFSAIGYNHNCDGLQTMAEVRLSEMGMVKSSKSRDKLGSKIKEGSPKIITSPYIMWLERKEIPIFAAVVGKDSWKEATVVRREKKEKGIGSCCIV
jgi:hypothetical protein